LEAGDLMPGRPFRFLRSNFARMKTTRLALLPLVIACGGPASPPSPPSVSSVAPATVPEPFAVLDAWHAAAARADEDTYFDHLADDAVFLGTDMTERWDKKAFRAYAHPHFAKGKAWTFHVSRRAGASDGKGEYAWFDEDLGTQMGPARGSGVLRRTNAGWKIVQYNLALTVPNDRMKEVRELLSR